MEPKISILTPVWNGLPYIKECINSVLKQDFQDWQLIVSDNGSTDGTLEYLDSLTDKRIRVIKQVDNIGIMANVNFLFQHSSAALSYILCADDYFIGTKALSTVIKFWQQAPAEVGFVTYNPPLPTVYPIQNLEFQVLPEIIKAGQADIWFLIFGNFCGNLSCMSVRTELVNKTSGFDLDFPSAGDFEFWTRLARLTAMAVQRDDIVYIRRHEKVASNYMNQKGEGFKQHVQIYEKIINALAADGKLNRKELISYFNYEICSYHYRVALKAASKGHFTYLKKLLKAKSAILWPLQRQPYLFSFSLINKRQRLTYPMAQQLLKINQHKPIKYESSNTSRGLWLEN